MPVSKILLKYPPPCLFPFVSASVAVGTDVGPLSHATSLSTTIITPTTTVPTVTEHVGSPSNSQQ
jgi:hypothetical protein